MDPHRRIAAIAIGWSLLICGCSKTFETVEAAPEVASTEAPATPQAAVPSEAKAKTTFDDVEKALASGAYDVAAAQLLEMRVRGKQFSDAEAAQYRQLLNDTYLQALEPAQKGDSRAKAAIEMIRTNPGR
ncbi:MAG TPA: hypothetical protein VM735_00355 [Candidatus Kapabacteria bacterium]|nr:hypothetical protein [Candidatus Kapabacteria bacterium]